MLMWALGPNPIHCLRCNGEVEPSQLPLPSDLVDAVAHWANIEGAIERLELDSGPYEGWAQAELLDLHRCYLVLFQRMEPSGEFVVPEACPGCAGTFDEMANGRLTRLLCEPCGFALVNR
jgi:hypothetical protein